MERRLEKIRSWKRCSVGSSNSSPRNMSLESGLILWRLNHELFPDPGSPMARITLPFGARGTAVGEAFAAACVTGAATSLSGVDSAGDPLDGAAATGRGPPLPRPPRPRRRLRRGSAPPPVPTPVLAPELAPERLSRCGWDEEEEGASADSSRESASRASSFCPSSFCRSSLCRSTFCRSTLRPSSLRPLWAS
jgi:hypothetical protein